MTVSPETAVPAAFGEKYGKPPQVVARAPGRVNLIGEHTDYNDGFVLPAALDKAMMIAASLRDDRTVNVHSVDFNNDASFSLDALRAPDINPATTYPRGVLWLLGEKGHTIRGMDLVLGSDVPFGAGLSSSAATAIAMIEATTALLNITLTAKEKALFGVEIEHQFIGVRTGVMDQLISVLGQKDHALLIDCRTLEGTPIPIPTGVSLLTLDTGKRRELTNTEYGKRREECEEAARLLGVKALRDVTPEQLAANADKLPETIERRAAHVVNEDVRTLRMADSLRAGDLATAGRLMNEGHASLRDMFQISIHELDVMADLAQREAGCYGARMMGGGFGGAVIALVKDEAVAGFSERVAEAYNAATHLRAYIYAAHPGAGSSVAWLGKEPHAPVPSP